MLDSLARERPDLVLLDVMMPVGDGRGAYRALRSRDDLRDIPVVVTSAGPRPDWLDGPEARFLPKPFDLGRLVAAVAGGAGGRGARR